MYCTVPWTAWPVVLSADSGALSSGQRALSEMSSLLWCRWRWWSVSAPPFTRTHTHTHACRHARIHTHSYEYIYEHTTRLEDVFAILKCFYTFACCLRFCQAIVLIKVQQRSKQTSVSPVSPLKPGKAECHFGVGYSKIADIGCDLVHLLFF